MSKKNRDRLDGLRRSALRFCKDSIEKIPGYLDAVNSSEPYDLHHVLELTMDGAIARTVDELKRMGMYFKRPYFELIFLPKREHSRIHNMGVNNFSFRIKDKGTARRKQSEAQMGHRGWNRGKTWSEQTRRLMREAHMGLKPTDETRRKLNVIGKLRATEYHIYKDNGGEFNYNLWSSKIWPERRTEINV